MIYFQALYFKALSGFHFCTFDLMGNYWESMWNYCESMGQSLIAFMFETDCSRIILACWRIAWLTRIGWKDMKFGYWIWEVANEGYTFLFIKAIYLLIAVSN